MLAFYLDQYCRIQKSVSPPVSMPITNTPIQLNHKVVDFRKEKAFLKDMAYLTGNFVIMCPLEC